MYETVAGAVKVGDDVSGDVTSANDMKTLKKETGSLLKVSCTLLLVFWVTMNVWTVVFRICTRCVQHHVLLTSRSAVALQQHQQVWKVVTCRQLRHNSSTPLRTLQHFDAEQMKYVSFSYLTSFTTCLNFTFACLAVASKDYERGGCKQTRRSDSCRFRCFPDSKPCKGSLNNNPLWLISYYVTSVVFAGVARTNGGEQVRGRSAYSACLTIELCPANPASRWTSTAARNPPVFSQILLTLSSWTFN